MFLVEARGRRGEYFCLPNHPLRTNAELNLPRSDVDWYEQVMENEKKKCSEIFRWGTCSDMLWHRLEEFTKELGNFV